MALRWSALGCTHIAAHAWFLGEGKGGGGGENRESMSRIAQPEGRNNLRSCAGQLSSRALKGARACLAAGLAWVGYLNIRSTDRDGWGQRTRNSPGRRLVR